MRQFIPQKRVSFGLISLICCIAATSWSAFSVRSSEQPDYGSGINSLGGQDRIRVLSLVANDISFNPTDSQLYVSVPSRAGETGNSIRSIDPATANVGAPVWIGSEPNRLSLSNDGQSLYVALDGAFAIRRFNTATQAAGEQFSLGFEYFAGSRNIRYAPGDLAVSPDNSQRLAIARGEVNNPSSFRPIAIYSSGSPLPQAGGFIDRIGSVAFSSSGSTLFGSGFSGLSVMTVTDEGITASVTHQMCASARIKYEADRIYCSTGAVISASAPSVLGTFPEAVTKAFVPDAALGRAFFIVRDPQVSTTWVLKAFDVSNHSLVGTLPITNVTGDVTNMVRWGANGLAFTTTGGKVYLVQTNLIPSGEPIPTPTVTPFPTLTPTPTPIETSYRYLALPANYSVFNPDDQKLYVSLPSKIGAQGNSIGIVNPETASLEQNIWIGSEPNKLAFASDRQKLYVALDGSRTVREFLMVSSTPGSEYPVGLHQSEGPLVIQDLVASPDSPGIIAASRRYAQTTGTDGVALFSGGLQYPQVRGEGYSLAFSASTATLYGMGNSKLEVMTNSGDGVIAIETAPFNGFEKIAFSDGRVYGTRGQVIDPADFTVPGTFTLGTWGPAQPLYVVDSSLNRILYVLNINGNFVLRAYDIDTFLSLGEVPLPGANSPLSIQRWGINGVAITQSNGPLIFVRSKLINPSEPVPTGTLPPSPFPTPPPAPTFVRRLFFHNSDMVVSPADSKLYVTIPETANGGNENSIARVNPFTGALESTTPIGTDPKRLVISNDGGTIYTSFDSPARLRRFDVQSQTPGTQFTVNTNGSPIADMAIDPTDPNKVVAAARYGGTGLYHNGVMLPNRPSDTPGSPFGLANIGQVRYSASSNLLYGFDNGGSGFHLFRIGADTGGLVTQTRIGNLLTGFFNDLQFAEGKLFTSDGRVVNPETNRILGTFAAQGKVMTVDTQLRKAFIASQGVVHVFDLDSYLPVGRIVVPVASEPKGIVRWGVNGLAIRFSIGGNDPAQIYIIQSPAVSNLVPIPLGHGLLQSAHFVSEDNTGVAVTVSRSGDLSQPSTVDYATSDITARAGQDYGSVSGTLTFAPGESSKNIIVPIFEDTIFENSETFSIALTNPTGNNPVLVDPSTATIEIGNDDMPPGIGVTEATIAETRVGTTTTVNVRLDLSNPSIQTVTVNYATANQTATSGTDYQSASGSVSFAPSETTKYVTVTILGDNLIEGTETFRVILSGATNGAAGPPGLVTIIDYIPEVNSPFDFDGDDKTDVAIFRPSSAEWWINRSSNGTTFATQFGAMTDKLAPGDYTGDGKADIAIWRPSSGEWFVLRSENSSFFSFPYGTAGDTPMPADYDADGKVDAAVYRASSSTWFIRRSSDGGTTIEGFGADGDVPVVADYDGDGKSDIAIYRPSLGQWWIKRSTAGVIAFTFGTSTDKPVQGDYTGDGKADVGFFRPSTGEWYVLRSEDFSYYSQPFGTSGDIPSPGDYDGDGKFDPSVFRPSSATWFSARSTAGTLIQQFGSSGDQPIPNAFVP